MIDLGQVAKEIREEIEKMDEKQSNAAEYSRPIREKILSKIVEYIETHGYPPTVREIGDMVGLKSTSSVHSHLIRMREEGMLESDGDFSSPRAIRVPGYKFVKVGG